MAGRLTVCGLGPGGRGRVTEATRSALSGAGTVYLRTGRHPSAELAPGAATFDHLYEEADTFDEVYRRIVEALVAAVDRDGDVVYAVPGSPLVLERSVRLLRTDPRIEVDLMPAVSFLDEVWARLGVDPVDDSVRLVDGHRFATQAAGERGPLLVAHAHAPWVLSDIKLALEEADVEQQVVVLQRLGTDDERVFEVSWPDLDREVEPDHLTSLYLPEVTAPAAFELARTVELMRRLRQECPWDRSQDHRSLRRYLIEEAYEVIEAIDGLGPGAGALAGPDTVPDGPGQPTDADAEAYAHLEEELGDLWLQVLFHAELATEAGQFTIADVARGLHDKMVARHPHVFDGLEVASAEEVRANWERIKNEEKGRTSTLDGIPPGLPALALADKTLSRLERAGTTITAAADGLAGDGAWTEQSIGRALLTVVVLARAAGVDAEQALRAVVTATADRYRDGDLPQRWVLG